MCSVTEFNNIRVKNFEGEVDVSLKTEVYLPSVKMLRYTYKSIKLFYSYVLQAP